MSIQEYGIGEDYRKSVVFNQIDEDPEEQIRDS
jgi:hypothetical protein